MSKSQEYAGFVGPTYRALSGSVSADRCINWYPEIVPTGVGKSKINYYPTPGLSTPISDIIPGVFRGLYAVNDRTFAVADANFYEFSADGTTGTSTFLGTVADDGKPVSFASNGTQIVVASAGMGYVYDGGQTFSAITGGVDLTLDPSGQTPGQFFGAAMFAFIDGYFIALTPNSRQIQISYLEDGTTWSALDVAENLGSADTLAAIIVDHEYLYLFGTERSTVWDNTGAADFPFAPIEGAFIEQGIDAAETLLRADNTLMWVGRDERGGGILWRANGFIPERVSTHAVEKAWQNYKTASDAISFLTQRNGHMEYRITFPSADESWCFDLTTNMWHERASFDPATGKLHAQIQRFHCYARSTHYVAGTDGQIHIEDGAVYKDSFVAIKRVRVAPVISSQNVRLFFPRLEVDVEPGVGLDGDQQGSDPTMMCRYSDDSGRNWSDEITASAGMIGETEARAVFDRLGSGMRRVFEISVTDPVNWVLIGAWLPGLEEGTH